MSQSSPPVASPRTPERPPAFTGREFVAGAAWAWVAFQRLAAPTTLACAALRFGEEAVDGAKGTLHAELASRMPQVFRLDRGPRLLRLPLTRTPLPRVPLRRLLDLVAEVGE